MTRNLGATTLRRTRRNSDPMRSYDALPAPLRNWVSQAALPWSPASVRRLWDRACANGLATEDALQFLSETEARSLAKDRHSFTSTTAQGN
ncbi:DUF6525 family protein [Tateyamaria omphalii]|uniref:DUF6525 family protein n=1 Tax=Tateyamaria omphalii TaxID=299262 RepID=UPI001C99EDBB|nr:DUF6525 family protein [Tateyamaria omphalii]